MINGICFDLGGTLIDSGPGFCTRITTQLKMPLSKLRPFFDTYFFRARVSRRASIQEFCKALCIEDVAAFDTSISESENRNVRIFDDVLPALQQLSCYRLAALSNVTPWEASDLSHLGIKSFFECVVYSFEIDVTKPDSRAFHTIERCLGLAPHQLVMVGDSFHADIRGAKKVGWKTVYLQRKKDFKAKLPLEADAVITSLAELPEVIFKL